MYRLYITLLCVAFMSADINAASGETSGVLPTITEKTADMEKFSGFMPFYWDKVEGKVWLEIDKWETELLYVNYLSHGIGSNDIGLDRGQVGNNRIVAFKRIGPKVLLIQPNYQFRAISDNLDERRAVEESFAQSVLWGFKVAAEEEGRVLVDASDFYLRDAHNVEGVLKSSDQGKFKLDPSRSVFNLLRTRNFPKNSEVDVMLTYIGDSSGYFLREVVPSPGAITVHQHHSFIQLPEDGYTMRESDPRAGFFGINYMDFSTPIGEPITKRFISRHRLEKENPKTRLSEPVKPIIYYLDRGTPEPIRSALIEGAEWWNQAFTAAGYQDAFLVKMLPEDADPMDVRYNVIQWVHRSTRGWSYGSTIIDPRTGEIIKGHVTLGSLRVRQDYLIAEGLLGPYVDDEPASGEMQKMALARLRQLSAHEVGHTLGLQHNYAASINNRASVMDYPHPYVKLTENGSIDLSEAYDIGIGEWDKVAIAYGYQDFPAAADVSTELKSIINKSISEGNIFISDRDARAAGGAHPLAHLWDNGSNAVDELERIMKIREKVLQQFSEKQIREGVPMAALEDVLVPVYMFHRYQVEAAAKVVGGMFYTYSVRGDGQTVTEIISPEEQRRALDVLFSTIHPKALALPENLLQMIPPKPVGYSRSSENFKTRTGLTFDPLSAAESVAFLTVQMILNPERAARLVEYHSRDNKFPGLIEVIDKLFEVTWKAEHKIDYHWEIQRVINTLILQQLLFLAGDESVSGQVRAIAFLSLEELKTWLVQEMSNEKNKSRRAHYLLTISKIEQFQKNPQLFENYKPLNPPSGPPIGSLDKILNSDDCMWY